MKRVFHIKKRKFEETEHEKGETTNFTPVHRLPPNMVSQEVKAEISNSVHRVKRFEIIPSPIPPSNIKICCVRNEDYRPPGKNITCSATIVLCKTTTTTTTTKNRYQNKCRFTITAPCLSHLT